MNELKGLLKLADNVTDKEIETAVTTLIADRERLQGENTILLADKERLTGENTALAGRVDEFTIAARDAKAAEAIALVDAAVKDGRINNTGRDAYLKLFDSNFENAKAVLDAIPVRQGVAERIQDGNTADAIELADLTKKSWDEIDKAGKLTLLKTKFPDVYNEKFEQRYGTKPKT